MEYIVSNVKISEATCISSNLWIRGNFKEHGSFLYLLDGYIIDHSIKDISEYCHRGLESHYANGAYNIIVFNKDTKKLEIKTDKRTTLPLYVYEKADIFAYSNNPWLLVKQFYNEIAIDINSLKAQLLYFADYHPSRTLFTNISRIGGANYICFDAPRNSKKSNCYWAFTYTPNSTLSTNQLLEQVDSDFTYFFQTIKAQNPDQTAGFGCSGGLDSRIIAHYIHKVGIKCKPYVIGDEKPHHILKSTTAKMSALIGDCYGFNVNFIPYHLSGITQSMILEIRNAPFIYSQAFINPYAEMSDVDYLFAGDPGGLTYMANSVLSGDFFKLKKHADFFIGYRQWAIAGLSSILRKTVVHLKFPFDPTVEQGLLGLHNSLINKVVDNNIRNSCQEELYACIDAYGGNNNIERWIRIHDNITTKYQYSSGYDSINHTKRCFLLYYPFYYDTIATLPLNFFKDKLFLKKIIEHINPTLLNIPDQNLNFIYGTNGWHNRLKNRFELALRGRGLNFLHLLRNPEYKKFALGILNRDNPIFYTVINKQQLLQSGLWQCYAGIQYLKLKMLLDIFYYRELDVLFENKQYEKPEW